MGTVTVLRPSSTSSGAGWTATPSGTLHGVTSDDSDSTYALWSGSGSSLVLQTPIDSPPVGERRHQVRTRLRGEDGDAWWSVILNNGQLVGGASAQFGASPETVIGSWGFGAPPDGPTVVSGYVTAQDGALKVVEVYVDVDSRLAPTLTAQTVDGSGTVTTTISDTATPVIRASAVDLDDLSARQYRYWVTRSGAVLWDTGIVSGPPSDRATTPLEDGSYVAHLQIWTTLGANTPYASDEETLGFTVSTGTVPVPNNPTVSPQSGTPFYEISACAPNVSDFDGERGWIEIQRVDCPIGGYLFLPGSAGATASTDEPGYDFTDLQVTVSAQRSDGWWPSTGDNTLAAWYDPTADQRGWWLYLDGDGGGDPAQIGRMILTWSTDGTAAGSESAVSTARAPVDAYGRATVRATLETDNGLGGWTAVFETFIDGEWEQVGDVVTGSGTTSIFSPTGDYTVGSSLSSGSPADRFTGNIYSTEIRDGALGPVIASPDFTGHMAGTSSFADDQGNTWAVTSPAAITSEQRTTTVALIGPLETDECGSWTDYTLPRTGIGATCEHAPESCCSYYRSRTVVRLDGAIQISDWSNSFNPGIPEGMIVMWPGTDASIPAGWTRTTELDGRYPKGIATGATQPGTQGGAALHTHTMTAHTHDVSHSHTVTGNTGTAVGTVNSHDGVTGTMAIAANHAHTRPNPGSTTVVSGATAPDVHPLGNDPDHLNVIFIESNGDPLGAPDGSLGLMADIAPPGWDTYDDATERFLKGAMAGADGGTTGVNTLNDHTHTVLDHTHAGTSHTHTSADTGSVTSNRSLFAGPNSATWDFDHAHPVTVGSGFTAALTSGGQQESLGSPGNIPPYRNLRVRQNTSGTVSLPVGLICAWRGSLGTIPEHWQVCDGTGGTPDLLARYPRGATTGIEGSGGSLDPHTHTAGSHTHSTPGHSHSTSVGPSDGTSASVSSTVTVSMAAGTHTHGSTDTDSATPTVGDTVLGTLGSTTAEPLHEQVAFVQLMEEPEPPEAPETFCLVWDDDEHLIRTAGPDGAMWAPVLGKFSWARDRPFTSNIGVNGTRFVTNAPPGERNLVMTAAVESETELQRLQSILARPLVLVSPSDSSEVWAAPVAGSVQVVKVGRIRRVTAEFIGTGPQPAPQLADMEV